MARVAKYINIITQNAYIYKYMEDKDIFLELKRMIAKKIEKTVCNIIKLRIY